MNIKTFLTVTARVTLLSALVIAMAATISNKAFAQTATPSATPSTVKPDIAGTGSATTDTSSQPADKPRQHFVIKFGPDIGVFIPTSSKTINRFGSAWYSVGVGIGNVQSAPSQGQFSLDLSMVSRYGSNSHIFVMPVGVQYNRAIGNTDASSVPYAGVSADVIFADIRSPQDNVHSGFHETGGGSAFIGSTLGKNAYVEARYLLNGQIKGFDTSGFNLISGFRF